MAGAWEELAGHWEGTDAIIAQVDCDVSEAICQGAEGVGGLPVVMSRSAGGVAGPDAWSQLNNVTDFEGLLEHSEASCALPPHLPTGPTHRPVRAAAPTAPASRFLPEMPPLAL